MIKNSNTTFISSLVEGYIDPKVYQDVQQTYARETISLLKYGNISITDTNTDAITRVQFTECEISPFHKHDIDCSETEVSCFNRLASKRKFQDKKIQFELIQKFLISAFSPDESGHRPYPSAGGLYPVEPLVFLFDEKVQDYEGNISGCYHFRPISKKLQLIKEIDFMHFYENMLHGFSGSDMKHFPGFCVMYVAHVGKAIFKYRYRGYRQALMEAGSMYQHASHTAQDLGLRTTVWSAFSEPKMMSELNLNHATYFPLTMQLFGYGD